MAGRELTVAWTWSAWRAFGVEVDDLARVSALNARFLAREVLAAVDRLAQTTGQSADQDAQESNRFFRKSVLMLQVYLMRDARGLVVLAVQPDLSEFMRRRQNLASTGHSLAADKLLAATRTLGDLGRVMQAEAAFLRTEYSTMGLPSAWQARFDETVSTLASVGWDLVDDIEDLYHPARHALTPQSRRDVDGFDELAIRAVAGLVRLVADLETAQKESPKLSLAWNLAMACGANVLEARSTERAAVEGYREAFDQASRA